MRETESWKENDKQGRGIARKRLSLALPCQRSLLREGGVAEVEAG